MSVSFFMSSASSPTLLTCTSTTTLREVCSRMHERHVSCIVIVDVDDASKFKAQGVATSSDIIRAIATDMSLDEPVSKVMSPTIYSIKGEYSLRQAAEAFSLKKVHHLAVTEGGVLKGIISSLDVARELSVQSKVWPYSRSFLETC